jgi:hypothetical protein
MRNSTVEVFLATVANPEHHLVLEDVHRKGRKVAAKIAKQNGKLKDELQPD